MYKALAHPEWDGYVTPYTLEERLAHIAEAQRTLQSRFTWLCDSMDNRLKHAMGDRPNSEFVVNADGVIVASRSWSDPKALRADLERLVGPVAEPTAVEDLDFIYAPPPSLAPRGVVPRITKPARMEGVKFTADWSAHDEPWYMKLRPEASRELLQAGAGQLYLGFRPDPLHGVHWNNLDGEAIRVKLEAPEGVQLSDSLLTGPDVSAPADSDAREFLVKIDSAAPGAEITVTVSYFACSDAEGWCKPIEQRYTVRLERDPDHFWVFDDEVNKAFNQRLGREAGKAATSDIVDVESRLPGTPSPELVERMNTPDLDGDR